MFNQLNQERKKLRKESDELILEAQRILINERFTEKKILDHLKQYNQSFELLNEDDIEASNLFTLNELKTFCIKNRMRFVDSNYFKGEFPYESILKIKDFNKFQKKDLCHFKILCPAELIADASLKSPAALFCRTMYGNYYLIHTWGENLSTKRKITNWPLRDFETFFVSVLLITAIITLTLPNSLLTTDVHVEYFSMYRAACFFHVLILLVGFSVFRMIATNKGLSSSVWDSHKV
ncbi:MAG: hypothetical protein IPG89_14795 [Bacteroidetes bacterium]|nr:hypothetical protein [Bacteroidota bacterium]